jgi:hypothetical protein
LVRANITFLDQGSGPLDQSGVQHRAEDGAINQERIARLGMDDVLPLAGRARRHTATESRGQQDVSPPAEERKIYGPV